MNGLGWLKSSFSLDITSYNVLLGVVMGGEGDFREFAYLRHHGNIGLDLPISRRYGSPTTTRTGSLTPSGISCKTRTRGNSTMTTKLSPLRHKGPQTIGFLL